MVFPSVSHGSPPKLTWEAQRQGEEWRRELELRLERRHAALEGELEELKHRLEQLSAAQQAVSKRQWEEVKQLEKGMEIRMVKAG